MITIKQLCEKIEMPEEMTTAILEFDNRINYDLIKEPLLQLCYRDTWDKALDEIKNFLGEDEKGIKILTCMLMVAATTYKIYDVFGMSEEIYFATMKCFSRFVNEHKTSYGTYGFDREFWTMRQASGRLFRIGELEYEMIEDDDKMTVAIHIPSDADMAREKLRESYKRAKAFIEEQYSYYDDVQMTCHSWLLSPTLKKMLSEDSNILGFQKAFDITTTGQEEKGYAEWLFKNPKLDIKDYPEDTSLQRKMKKYLLDGGTVEEAKGVLIEPAFEG